jgi:hypothetical protein
MGGPTRVASQQPSPWVSPGSCSPRARGVRRLTAPGTSRFWLHSGSSMAAEPSSRVCRRCPANSSRSSSTAQGSKARWPRRSARAQPHPGRSGLRLPTEAISAVAVLPRCQPFLLTAVGTMARTAKLSSCAFAVAARYLTARVLAANWVERPKSLLVANGAE